MMTLTESVLQYFLQRPEQWVDAHELLPVGGFAAWRTRLSEARQLLQQSGQGTIDNQVMRERRADGRAYLVSRYRYVPARDAAGPERLC